MDILVLDANFKAIDVVDTFISLIWTDRYDCYGDFEIYTPTTLKNIETFKRKRYLWMEESEHVMIIESIQNDTDAENGPKLIIQGRSLESILDRRVIWRQTILSGNLQNGIKQLLDENIISPEIAERKIDNFIFEESDDPAITELTIDAQFTGDDLYTAISDICIYYGIGFKITLNENNQFVFKLYAGKDRSYSQMENPYVVFSPNFDNIINSSYIESDRNYKTTTLVAGEGEGAERKTIAVDATEESLSGLDRREMFTDARDISSITYDGQTITDEEYYLQLALRGFENLDQNTIINSFDGQVETDHMYNYGDEFFMGDIVQRADEYGNESRCQVIEFIRSYSDSGVEAYPTFSIID